MNFTKIYEDRVRFFPEIIEIADGQEIEETEGILFPKLSQLWDTAETLSRNQAECYFVWAYFKVLHKRAKAAFIKKTDVIKTTEIDKIELEREYRNVIQEAEKIKITKFCCDMMQSQLTHKGSI